MKLKKARVRLSDIHHGKVIYIGTNKFTMEKHICLGKPYLIKLGINFYSWFADMRSVYINHDGTERGIPYTGHRSLQDMGVVSNRYNDRAAYHKLKHAVQHSNTVQYSKPARQRVRNPVSADFHYDVTDPYYVD